MQHIYIRWISRLIAVLALLIAAASVFYISQSTSYEQPPIVPRPSLLPESAFSLKPENYEKIGEGALELQFDTPKLGVPDFRTALVYHGRNLRPDAQENMLYFSLSNPQDIRQIQVGRPVYLLAIDRPDRKWDWSPQNQPTDTWFKVTLKGKQVQVEVRAKNEEGEVADQPRDRATFTLTEKPIPAGSYPGWNIDQLRVDGTLLIRQKAKWSGRDLFLEKHGGSNYQDLLGKQRIVFGTGDQGYSVYVATGDFLVWKDGRWQTANKNEKTEGLPLLKAEKIDERIMSFTIYDPTGKWKQTINLIKTPDPLPAEGVEQEFQFAGARTRIHSMFKIGRTREIVGPQDWFLLAGEGWKKLKSGKEIDSFVSGETRGTLLVIDRISKENEEKWLDATLFNPSRSESTPIMLPLRAKERMLPPEEQVTTEREAPADAQPGDSKTTQSNG